jgi:hypothetical protein
VPLTNDTVSGNFDFGVRIINDAGDLTLNVSGGTYANTNASQGEDGINVQGTGTGSQTVNVQNATFTSNKGDQIQVLTDNSNTVTQDVTINGSTLTPSTATTSTGITVSPAGTASVMARVTGNTVTGGWGAVNMNFNSNTGSGHLHSRITDNILSSKGDTVNVQASGSGTSNSLIKGNNIQGWNEFGLRLFQGDGTGSMNASVKGNTIKNPDISNQANFPPIEGMRAQTGTAGSGDTGTSCYDIGGAGADANDLTGSHNVGEADLKVRQRFATTLRMPGYTGTSTDTAAVITYLQLRNTAPITSATHDGTGGFTNSSPSGSVCPQPPA